MGYTVRRQMTAAVLGVAVTLGGALSGCSAPADAATAPARTPLSACTDLPSLPSARCGSITVPLDRGNPRAGTTSVAFALVPRTDQSRPSLGTVVGNPGGPGTSTIDLSGPQFAAVLAPILDRRDLLLIDPRGVGRSDPLTCPALATSDSVFEGIEAQRKAIGDCGRQLGAESRYYGTAAVADDFDDVRKALGLDRLDLLGVSYGTYLMPVYAQRHPAHVRSVVLSGAYAVNQDPGEVLAATALRRAVTLVCDRSKACSGPAVLNDLGHLATRLRRSPTTVDVDYRGRTHHVRLDEWALAGAVSKIYSTSADRDAELGLATAAAAARHGDLDPIRAVVRAHLIDSAKGADSGPREVSIPASWATSCHDYLRSFDFADSLAARRRDYDRHVAGLDPKDFAPFSPAAWVTRDSFDSGACLRWPDDPTARPPFGPGAHLPDVPVLVLAGDLDANTPTPAGRAAGAQFPHAKVIEVPDAGHTPVQTPAGARLAMDFIVTAGR
jgi:pimeloyl-ACP methyl ester carboxylesterase